MPLGGTGVRVTALGLGCAPLGNLYERVGEDQGRATVDAAWDAGIRWFDTAPLYGHGLAERRLGEALARRPRPEVVVATKVGRLLVPGDDPDGVFVDVPPVRPVFDVTTAGVRRSLEASFERLGLDRVDVVHVHDPDEHEGEAREAVLPELRRLRDEGVVGAVGAGMNQSAMLTRFVRAGLVDCVLLAGRYTLLDQSALDDLLPAALEAGVAVIVGGVFNSGVLADPGPGATFDYAPAGPAVLERAAALAAVCRRFDVPLAAAALQLPAAHPAVASVLIGARSADEVRQNVARFERPVPVGLWDALRSAGLLRPDAPTPG
ncbi:MAG: aldo/keto reductase [Acidimicrobiales bacterium]|nr:aldo/keto reductase [Acidimicrobiales bacterium]